MENQHYPFVNLPLPYAYNALEPFLDEKTMHLHHDRHLQTYIDNLNGILEKEPGLQTLSLEQLIQIADRLPENLGTSLRNNAGGVYNHRFFFNGMAPATEGKPSGELLARLQRRFGSWEDFREDFKKAALSVFGSGYAWLVDGPRGLRIVTTPNQNSPIAWSLRPILTIDVWEHAYYLKHYNLRADYIDDWFALVNWEQAQERAAH
ncbi:MAG: superoxide dismutase [Clostridiales bacterium]|nr:superoxide dismutase [Clostridiales bacterium]MDY4172280.1 superoxide dismutase [Evtepia sp.]